MREYVIDSRSSDMKLFNFIQKIAPVIKNSDLFKIIRKGVITVNDKKVDFSYRLKENDILLLHLSEQYFTREEKDYKYPHYKLDIIFENDDIIIINKPRGLLVHSDGKEYRNNMVEYIKGYLYYKREWSPDHMFTPTVCNRLDFNTSGLIVSAKNQKALTKITALFRKRDNIKKYYTLVSGKSKGKYFISSLIQGKPGEENMMESVNTEISYEIPDKDKFISENPQLSAMVVSTVRSTDDYSLLNIELWTGRKHQIRTQLLSINHPLLGDFKYYTPLSVKLSNAVSLDGYYLHSHSLNLGEYGTYECPPDPRFEECIDRLFP
jgi:23S rRNA pseudouridine955/2504/2580 synthase